jgi:hypothetical protein
MTDQPTAYVPQSPSYIHIDFVGNGCQINVSTVSNGGLMMAISQLTAMLARSGSMQTQGLVPELAVAESILNQIKQAMPGAFAVLAPGAVQPQKGA